MFRAVSSVEESRTACAIDWNETVLKRNDGWAGQEVAERELDEGQVSQKEQRAGDGASTHAQAPEFPQSAPRITHVMPINMSAGELYLWSADEQTSITGSEGGVTAIPPSCQVELHRGQIRSQGCSEAGQDRNTRQGARPRMAGRDMDSAATVERKRWTAGQGRQRRPAGCPPPCMRSPGAVVSPVEQPRRAVRRDARCLAA